MNAIELRFTPGNYRLIDCGNGVCARAGLIPFDRSAVGKICGDESGCFRAGCVAGCAFGIGVVHGVVSVAIGLRDAGQSLAPRYGLPRYFLTGCTDSGMICSIAGLPGASVITLCAGESASGASLPVPAI